MLRGTFGLWDVSPQGIWTPRAFFPNTIMTTMGFAVAKALGHGDSSYRINKFYIEYENTTGAISNPAFTKNDSRSYYDNLTSPKDYLRVNIDQSPNIEIASGYESVFTSGVDGNKMTFKAVTSGTQGENGLAFSDTANSTVYGVALVAAPDDSDKTKDVLISRGYYASSAHKTKQATGQIGVSWTLEFLPP